MFVYIYIIHCIYVCVSAYTAYVLYIYITQYIVVYFLDFCFM